MKYGVFWKNPGYKGHPELKEDLECDYLIVGGGVTGVSLAYFLNKLGAKNIVLIEKNQIASGATGKAAGSLVLEGELDLQQIIQKLGKKKGEKFWEVNKQALQNIKSLVKKEKISCDFDEENTIYGSIKRKGDADVLDEYILQKGVEKSTQLLVGSELRKTINTPLFRYAMISPKHGISVNPLQFTQNLSTKLKNKGVSIYENTELIKLHHHHNIAETCNSKIKFKEVILALDSDTRHSDIRKIRSTIIVTEKLNMDELKKLGLKTKKIVWDSKDIYHYMKVTRDNRILLGYGDKNISKKHKNIKPHKPHLMKISSFLRRLFPQVHLKIDYAWSGSFGATDNKFPIIEKIGNKVILAGASSQVVCFMSAEYLAHKLLGKKSNLEEFFDVK